MNKCEIFIIDVQMVFKKKDNTSPTLLRTFPVSKRIGGTTSYILDTCMNVKCVGCQSMTMMDTSTEVKWIQYFVAFDKGSLWI